MKNKPVCEILNNVSSKSWIQINTYFHHQVVAQVQNYVVDQVRNCVLVEALSQIRRVILKPRWLNLKY